MKVLWELWFKVQDCFEDWTSDDSRLLLIGWIGVVCLIALALQVHVWLS